MQCSCGETFLLDGVSRAPSCVRRHGVLPIMHITLSIAGIPRGARGMVRQAPGQPASPQPILA